MTGAPLDRKARIVSELQDRLAEAEAEEVASFLADQLGKQVTDLEGLCISALRTAREKQAMVNSLKSIRGEMDERIARLERSVKTIRDGVAHAMMESGLPKIVAPDLTVSFRVNKPALIIDGEPNHFHREAGFATETVSFKWDKDAIREAIEDGREVSFARLANQPPSLTIRGK